MCSLAPRELHLEESPVCSSTQTVQCAEWLRSPPRPEDQAAGSVDPELSKKVLSDLFATATLCCASTGFWGSHGSSGIFPEKGFNTVPPDKDLSDLRPTSTYQSQVGPGMSDTPGLTGWSHKKATREL